MKKIRLLLIEDNRLLRDGIIAMLKKQNDIKIVAASGDDKNTVKKIMQVKPGVILLDLGLRSQDSLTLVEIVKKNFPEARIIVMDLAPVQVDINLFVKAGVSGFILKDATVDDFLVTIRAVADGENVVPPNLGDSLFTSIVENALKGGEVKLKEAVLMPNREREVIVLLGDGLSNKDIAQKMQISTFTVKSHIHNIMEKVALHTRLEIANYSYSDRSLKKVVKDISTVN